MVASGQPQGNSSEALPPPNSCLSKVFTQLPNLDPAAAMVNGSESGRGPKVEL